MVADPCEAMGNIVAAEASLLQASADTDLLLDAEAISEAETQRSRLRIVLRLPRAWRCAFMSSMPRMSDAWWPSVTESS